MNRLKDVLAKSRGVLYEVRMEDFKLRTRTKVLIRNKKGTEIPAGAEVTATLGKAGLIPLIFLTDVRDSNRRIAVMLTRAEAKVRGFTKMPSNNTLAKWDEQGVAQTITGKRVEPDGYGPDGSPSWLLVLGLI